MQAKDVITILISVLALMISLVATAISLIRGKYEKQRAVRSQITDVLSRIVSTKLENAKLFYDAVDKLDFVHLSQFASQLIGSETHLLFVLKGWPCSPCRSP
jgi:hypothetical protein